MILRLLTCLLLYSLPLNAAAPPQPAVERSADLKRLQRVSAELQRLEQEMGVLQQAFKVKERGFYTADEHDRIESLLFRYLMCRDALWDLVDRYRGQLDQPGEPGDGQAREFVLCFSAALNLSYYGSTLIKTFDSDALVIAKLNEAFHRTRIPAGTWNRLFKSVTNVEHLRQLRGAWKLYEAELKDPASPLVTLINDEPSYAELHAGIRKNFAASNQNTTAILTRHALLLPAVRNRLRHSIITELYEKTADVVDDRMKAARAVLFLRVSRLKNPMKGLITFSPKQVEELKAQLEPGDVILTYTAGYMSNLFLPGTFKHGMTWVGSPEARQAAGLNPLLSERLPAPTRAAFRRNLVTAETAHGATADLVEAVAEGVIFSNFEHLLHTHVNRLVVLRPRLGEADRVAALATAFSLIDNPYDFGFDFNDGSYHCCTEVIYRALHGRGPIRLSLTPRMGKPTLSADDILSQYFEGGEKMFEFVLLAEAAEGGSSHAALRGGEPGLERLRRLMGLQ